jgi:hypothetical protein
MITIEKSDPDDDWVKIEKIQTFETTDTILSNRNKRNEILTCLIEVII